MCCVLFVPGAFHPLGCGTTASSPSSGGSPLPATSTAARAGDDVDLAVAPTLSDALVPPILLDGDSIVSATELHTARFSPAGSDLFGPDFTADPRASFHPHGEEVCASGCAASRHPTPELSREHFRKLIAEFSLDPMNESSRALEELLYYGRQTQSLIRSAGVKPLNQERARFLKQELRRTHALWSFRIVDEMGVVRSEMKRTRVPLDRRHVFDMEEDDLPPLITSGTVKRVGLHHLWTRI